MLKTLWQAIIMTLRGERPIRRHGKLADWIEASGYLSDSFIRLAEQTQIDLTRFQAKVDGRTQSLKTIVHAVNYHAKTEYPYLLNHLTEHSVTAVYATNMNDTYAVKRILEDETLAEQLGKDLHRMLQDLSALLDGIPPSTELAG
jgi:hypothetical protein